MDEEKDGFPETVIYKETSAVDDRPKEPPEDIESSQHQYVTGWRLALVTISLALGMFLTGVDSSIIGVATPGIITSFHAIDDLAWYGSGYMLPHTVLQPILGVLYKSFNVRYVFLTSIIIFEVGSCLCAAAPTSTSFIIGRVIAGCGAAGLQQGTLATVGFSVPKKTVPLYYGYVLSVQGVSACTAPIFGGIFIDKVSWRWCFWINLQIGGVALAMVMLFVKPKLPKHTGDIRSLPAIQRLRRMDWAGTLIFLSAFICLFIALQWGGQTKPWRSSEVIGLFVGFALLLGLFVYTQKFTGEDSLIPRRILKQQTVLFGTIYLIFFGLQMAVYLQYIPIYFQAIRGTSATNSGVRMIAMDVGRIIFIIISGFIVTKFGYYMPYMVIGTMINVVAAGLLTILNLDTSTARSTAFMFLAGAGAGIGGNQPFIALQAALKEEDLSIGNGLTVFGLQLGTSLAFAISQPVFLTKIFSRLSSDTLTSNISRSSIIAAGASHLNRLVDNPAALKVVRKAYSEGIRDTMMVALVAICLCLLCPPGMEWLKL
ncbi:hypothetical protein EYC80_010754 [Monilinia laxa]|uniref:Major facilitator superfamily (MFS) profile domain-containing protein n=1 Tax=Monilinia laxa TaxID=61186 RepID=A0A5N6JNN9_MONLA|nr:hypothetical protein EYC80_010754 [Monilinia laxa]